MLAALALVNLAEADETDGGVRPPPPAVISGSAQSNCLRILAAGYAPHDYVLSGGAWRYAPEWDGVDGARMSWIWRSAPACLIGAAVPPAGVLPPLSKPATAVSALTAGAETPVAAGSQPVIRESETVRPYRTGPIYAASGETATAEEDRRKGLTAFPERVRKGTHRDDVHWTVRGLYADHVQWIGAVKLVDSYNPDLDHTDKPYGGSNDMGGKCVFVMC